jgi:hypothetical protein
MLISVWQMLLVMFAPTLLMQQYMTYICRACDVVPCT